MNRVVSILSLVLPTYHAVDVCSTKADRCQESKEVSDESDEFSALQPLRPRMIAEVEGAIPKIVHHIYKTDISNGPWPNPLWKTSFLAWKKWFPEPEFKHIFWSDDRMMSFVKQNCPKYIKTFAGEKRGIVRSDFSRYCVLWSMGGIYADLDYQPMSDFFEDLQPGKVNLVQSPYLSETYQNSLMASPPNHVYWKKLMDLAQFTMMASNVLLAAGPQLLETLPLTHDPKVVHSLSCNEFQRATHTDDEKERQASFRKNCKSLRPEDVGDPTLKGIHWGTVSYTNGPAPVVLTQATKSWSKEAPVGLISLFDAFSAKASHETHGTVEK